VLLQSEYFDDLSWNSYYEKFLRLGKEEEELPNQGKERVRSLFCVEDLITQRNSSKI
jgi:hypothetical protein